MRRRMSGLAAPQSPSPTNAQRALFNRRKRNVDESATVADIDACR
jgi:hypothetical protein